MNPLRFQSICLSIISIPFALRGFIATDIAAWDTAFAALFVGGAVLALDLITDRTTDQEKSMNALQRIFAELSDADLRAGCLELQAMEDSGVLPDGTVRALARRIEAEAGLSAHEARSVVNSNLYRIAALKWVGFEG